MTRPLVALLLLPIAPGTGCAWDECGSAELDVSLPNPGDSVEIRARLCPARGQSYRMELAFEPEENPDTPIAITMRGLEPGEWSGLQSTDDYWRHEVGFGSVNERGDCDPGRTIVIERLDDDNDLSVEGTIRLWAEAYRRRCPVELVLVD